MNKYLTFPKGGVHPHDSKARTKSKPIKNSGLPSVFIVPLSQHIGSPAECLVQPGDVVKEGMLIGKSTGFISATVHSPVPGKVKEIKDVYLPMGVKSQAVVIELEGEFDRSGKIQEKQPWEQRSTQQLLEIIEQNGLVGMGGATFPLHVKYSIPKGSSLEYFVVNGAECEPYLTADHRLMLEKPQEIVEGIRIAAKILKPERIYIGIEKNKPDAIAVLEKLAAESGLPLEVKKLQMKYPQGDEKQLLKAVINREVPSGKLPLNIGAVVSNVATLFALYEAVVFNKPVIERVLTVTGGAIKEPGNFKARVGTPLGNIIQECGGFKGVPEKLVMGGPMMGFTVVDLDTPITKGTSGILALTAREVNSRARTACIQCGRCVGACPLGLNPTQLFKLIDHGHYDVAMGQGLMDCKECGCCGYSCPAHIPLIQGMKLGKRMHRKLKG